MRIRLHRLTVGLLSIAALLMGMDLANPSHDGALARSAQSCAAAGSYTVGGRPVPLPEAHSGTLPSYPSYFPGGLVGSIVLQAFTSCGSPTLGSFQVHAAMRLLPQPVLPKSSTTTLLPIAATSVLTATGTFSQDPAHPGDPNYVLVSGTISYGHYRWTCNGACAPDAAQAQLACLVGGCGNGHPIVSRVLAFAHITGYLRWQDATPATVGLLFLPPPDISAPSPASTSLLSAQPMSLFGIRDKGR